MARGGREQREGNALKTALVVTGGLVLVWVTVETAFGSFLSRLRGAVDRSNPRTDPDDDEVNAAAAASPPPPQEEVKDENDAENPRRTPVGITRIQCRDKLDRRQLQRRVIIMSDDDFSCLV